MTKFLTFISALLVSFGVVAASQAADLPPRRALLNPAPAIPVFTWTGLYVGINGAALEGKRSDFAVGGTLGFNYQIDRVVLGVEGDLAYTDTKGLDRDYLGTVRARIGYAFGPVLPYATGGYAYRNISLGNGFDRSQHGWVVGGGLEYALTTDVSVKAEYLYADFGRTPLVFGKKDDGRVDVVRLGVNYRF